LRRNGYLPLYVARPTKEPVVAIHAVLRKETARASVQWREAQAAKERTEQIDLNQIHELMVKHFNAEEVQTLCFRLGQDYDRCDFV
jgi:hypothetical protein